MQQTTIRILKSVNVENPLPFNQWCKIYNVGSRVQKINNDCDRYISNEYDFNKLVNIIKYGNKKPSLYARILNAITT